MIRFDCYWMDMIREHGCTDHVCARHEEPKYDPECDGCDDYISGYTVYKMVRFWADIMRSDFNMGLRGDKLG